MNKAILVREKVTRLVKMMVEKKISVTQRGSTAFVEYDSKGIPRNVNIPYIPDEATEEFLSAIEGFLDHEVAHVLFTDPRVLAKAKKSGVTRMHNIIEDAFIEKKMASQFAGSGFNLKNVGEFFLKTYTDQKLKEDPDNAIAYLMVPAIRALSGQTVFKDYMEGKWHLLDSVMKKIGDHAKEVLPNMMSSEDALKAALKFKELLDAPDETEDAPESEEKGKKAKKSGGKGKKGKKTEDEPEEESEGSSEDEGEDDSEPDDEEGDPSDGEGESGPEDGEGGEGDGEGVGGDEDDGELEITHADTSEDSDEDPIDGEEDHKGKGEKPAEDEDEGEDEDSSESGGASGGVGGGSSKPSPTSADLEATIDDDYSKHIAEELSGKALEEGKSSKYLIYTKDLDEVEPMKVGESGHWDDSMLREMQDTVDHMVGPLQKDLERAVAARSKAIWSAGHRSGRLHASSLARLTAFNDDRAFRRKHETETKDVAVELVIDCSGSMSGGKIRTAAYAAYGLSSVLDRMNINCEIVGFTTRGRMPSEMRSEESRLGVRYARQQSLYIPIIKSFSERLSTESKKRFAALPNVYWLCENVDGESIQIAATRLMQRREKRKILIVLSDGQPACPGDTSQQIWHLKHVVKEIERAGVDVLGLGIQSEAPKHFYSKYTILNNVAELPTTVIGEIKRLLMK